MSPSPADEPLEDSFDVEVMPLILDRHTREQLEAVVGDALKILGEYEDRPESLIFVSRQRLAIILDRQARRGMVMPVELVDEVLDDAAKARLHAWLTSPPTPFYVIHVVGSWFED